MSAWKIIAFLVISIAILAGCETRPEDARQGRAAPLSNSPVSMSSPQELNGVVVDGPYSQMNIAVYRDEALVARTHTDSAGRFSLPVPSGEGAVKIVARAPLSTGGMLELIGWLGSADVVKHTPAPFRAGLDISAETTAAYLLQAHADSSTEARLSNNRVGEFKKLATAIKMVAEFGHPLPSGFDSTSQLGDRKRLREFMNAGLVQASWKDDWRKAAQSVIGPEDGRSITESDFEGTVLLSPKGLLAFHAGGRGTAWQPTGSGELAPVVFGWAFDRSSRRLSIQFAGEHWSLVVQRTRYDGFLAFGTTNASSDGHRLRFKLHRVRGMRESDVETAYWSWERSRSKNGDYRYVSFSGAVETGGKVQVMEYHQGRPAASVGYDFQLLEAAGIRLAKLERVASEEGRAQWQYWVKLNSPEGEMRMAQLTPSSANGFTGAPIETLEVLSAG